MLAVRVTQYRATLPRIVPAYGPDKDASAYSWPLKLAFNPKGVKQLTPQLNLLLHT